MSQKKCPVSQVRFTNKYQCFFVNFKKWNFNKSTSKKFQHSEQKITLWHVLWGEMNNFMDSNRTFLSENFFLQKKICQKYTSNSTLRSPKCRSFFVSSLSLKMQCNANKALYFSRKMSLSRLIFIKPSFQSFLSALND